MKRILSSINDVIQLLASHLTIRLEQLAHDLEAFADGQPEYWRGYEDGARDATALAEGSDQERRTEAHDWDHMLICRKCDQGMSVTDIQDGEKRCPGRIEGDRSAH